MELCLGDPAFLEVDAAKAASVRTLMVAEEKGGDHKVTDAEFATLLAKFTSLKELHWHFAKVTTKRMEALLEMAPAQMIEGLTTLSMPLASCIDPEALALCAAFSGVRLLSLYRSFTTEFWYEGYEEEYGQLPYDSSLFEIFDAMLELEKVNLGPMDRYMYSYALGRDVIEELQLKRGGRVELSLSDY
jgi:hypothetical protein